MRKKKATSLMDARRVPARPGPKQAVFFIIRRTERTSIDCARADGETEDHDFGRPAVRGG